MSEKERMLAERLYLAQGEELKAMRQKGQQLIRLFNATTEEEKPYRTQLLMDIFGEVAGNIYIEPTLRVDYGQNITIGKNFYANFDCVMIDVAPIKIGDNAMFGPRVCLYTAGHPIDPTVRNSGLEFGTSITIGNNVWIGGSAVVNPGVTIGDNVIIGSGSVVTKNVPSNTIAVGNPCRVIRDITQEDKDFWEDKQAAYWSEIANEQNTTIKGEVSK
ncbi:sugar O-acetyltransferase [Carnobacterium viridans]|uniref:Acetyltransferase n=1 Tax=Carnobacterium viridans TaxID=174587 RepID=A0A1H0ZDF9_9LACT|nr:sugar O-acetyltransferase [Carnobacterium viridans]UDE94686.1 sugar O-acetyltransferase [Carnobacterium viridans]SDQ25389.1 maltose O-acetyltransferase [Carnobacterium viridans]